MANKVKDRIADVDIIRETHRDISSQKTPDYYVEEKGGYEYVDEAYMRTVLNEAFPIWSWEVQKYEFIEDKAIAVHGRLTVEDNGVTRHFESVAAHRIVISQKSGNYADLGNDLKSAVTDCFKVCVNRLCNICDDIYRKQVLTSSQILEVEYKLAEVDDAAVRGKVVRGIKKKNINATNLKQTLDRLEQIIKQQKNKKKEN